MESKETPVTNWGQCCLFLTVSHQIMWVTWSKSFPSKQPRPWPLARDSEKLKGIWWELGELSARLLPHHPKAAVNRVVTTWVAPGTLHWLFTCEGFHLTAALQISGRLLMWPVLTSNYTEKKVLENSSNLAKLAQYQVTTVPRSSFM